MMLFQSTHPCGVRLHAFCDWSGDVVISIHAPVWGATVLDSELSSIDVFQSTHPCGVRRGVNARFVASLVLA